VKRIAVIGRTATAINKYKSQKWLQDAFGDYVVYSFVEYGVDEFGELTQECAMPIYSMKCKSVFDVVVIDHSFNLIDSEWSKVFVKHAHSMLTQSGKFLLPKTISSKLAWRDALQSCSSEVRSNGKFESFEKKSNLELEASSVLSWYVKNSFETLLLASNEQNQRHLESTEKDGTTIIESVRYNLIQQLNALGYFIGGLSYKAPIIKHIIASECENRNNLNLIDMGAGYGLLAAEMLIDPSLNMENVVATDISSLNRKLANFLKSGLASKKKLFHFVEQPAQEYLFEKEYDVVMFVGSLLYVPKEQLKETIERAWAAVKDGGILIVHENIKHEKYSRDFDMMFTTNDIEKLLQEFGEITRYSSLKPVKVTKLVMADKTLFRVVKKHPRK